MLLLSSSSSQKYTPGKPSSTSSAGSSSATRWNGQPTAIRLFLQFIRCNCTRSNCIAPEHDSVVYGIKIIYQCLIKIFPLLQFRSTANGFDNNSDSPCPSSSSDGPTYNGTCDVHHWESPANRTKVGGVRICCGPLPN